MVDPTRRFVELVSRPEWELPLDEAAFLIAAHAQPGLDVDAQRRRLDDLTGGERASSVPDLCELLFRRLGFVGNADDYHDPRNSYLDQVLDRRTGIPITLSLVAMEVGRRMGVPLDGVGLPGHFLLRDGGDPSRYVDAFHGGRLLDEAGVREVFCRVHGDGTDFDAAYLEPVGPRAILARMLANLKTVHVARRDFAQAEWAIRLRLAIPGVPRIEACELAVAVGSQGRFREAARELEALAGILPDDKGDAVLRRARSLRARLN